MMAARSFAALVAGGLIAAGSVFPAYAQDAAAAAPAAPASALEVELNALAPSQKGCMMTFVALNKLERIRDDLNIEFGRLQLEQATWAESNRVDQVARTRLGMVFPRTEDIVVVRR